MQQKQHISAAQQAGKPYFTQNCSKNTTSGRKTDTGHNLRGTGRGPDGGTG